MVTSLVRRLLCASSLVGMLLVSGCAAPSTDSSTAPSGPASVAPSAAASVTPSLLPGPVVRDSTLRFDDGSSAELRVTAGPEDQVAFVVEPQGPLDLGEVTVDVSVNGSAPVSVPVARQGRGWAGSARLRPGTWTVEVSGTSDADGFSTTLTARSSVNLSEATP